MTSEQVEAQLCAAALQSADDGTRQVWLRLGCLHGFTNALALQVAALAGPDGERQTAVRRFCELPFIEPCGENTWHVCRGAHQTCLSELDTALGDEAYRRFHNAVADLIERQGTTARSGWAQTEYELAIAFHRLPADNAAGLAMLFRIERRAAHEGRVATVDAIVDVCRLHQRYTTRGLPELHYFIGKQALHAGQYGRARQELEAALAACGPREDELVAVLLSALGQAYFHCDDVAGALACLHRSRVLHDRLGLPSGALALTLQLGRSVGASGQHEAAQAELVEARRLAQALNDEPCEAAVLEALGETLARAGNRTDAEKALRQARKFYRRLGDLRGEMRALWQLGDLYLEAGQLSSAATALMNALDLAQEVHNDRVLSGGLQSLGQVYRRMGRQELFLLLSEKQTRLERLRRNKYGEFFTQCHVGDAWYDLGDYEQALAAYKRAVELSDRQGNVTRHCRQRVKELEDRLGSAPRARTALRLVALDGCARRADEQADDALHLSPVLADVLRRRIAAATVIAIDAGLLRQYLIGKGAGAQLVRVVCEAADRNRLRMALSALAAGTLCEWLRQQHQGRAADRLERVCTEARSLLVIPVDADLAMRVARLRTTHPDLPVADVCELMTAQLARADLFLTASPTLAQVSRVPAFCPTGTP